MERWFETACEEGATADRNVRHRSRPSLKQRNPLGRNRPKTASNRPWPVAGRPFLARIGSNWLELADLGRGRSDGITDFPSRNKQLLRSRACGPQMFMQIRIGHAPGPAWGRASRRTEMSAAGPVTPLSPPSTPSWEVRRTNLSAPARRTGMSDTTNVPVAGLAHMAANLSPGTDKFSGMADFRRFPAGRGPLRGLADRFVRMRDTSCGTPHMHYNACNKSGSETPG